MRLQPNPGARLCLMGAGVLLGMGVATSAAALIAAGIGCGLVGLALWAWGGQ